MFAALADAEEPRTLSAHNDCPKFAGEVDSATRARVGEIVRRPDARPFRSPDTALMTAWILVAEADMDYPL